MKPIVLSTTATARSAQAQITLGSRIYAVGSCFAALMAERLNRYLFPTLLNPYGIAYNPITVAQMLEPRQITHDLFLHDGLWRSLSHHSSLASPSRGQALQALEDAETAKLQGLRDSRWLLLTLGTAQVFTLADGRVAGNCQRLPQALFRRRRLQEQECLQPLQSSLLAWLDSDSRRQAVVTVSPVRYLRDGLVENNRGKAALLLACEALENAHPRVTYFPAYEILIDELRDYRFYERDLAHPSALAVDIIWQRFAATFLHSSCLSAISEMDKIHALLQHRPSTHTDSQALAAKLRQRLERLRKLHPELDAHCWWRSLSHLESPQAQSSPD
jgi:hypothetical protein